MMRQVANEEMIRNAVGDEETERMMQPPFLEASTGHVLWPQVQAALREVYDRSASLICTMRLEVSPKSRIGLRLIDALNFALAGRDFSMFFYNFLLVF